MPRLASSIALLAAVAATAALAQDPADLTELARRTHIHGLAFDPQDKDRVLLATHNGFYAFDLATQVLAPWGESRQDFMGFTVDPAGTFYGSGHPETGGNSGVIISQDRGHTWVPLSDGANGPVDFHQLTVSPADPATLYGAYRGDLQHSHDAGVTWDILGPVPDGLIDLAASALDPEILYAATETGLLMSVDGGETWAPAHPAASPVTFVETHTDGGLHAYVLDLGLIRATEGSLDWTLVSEPIGGEYILHFAVEGTRAIAATGSGTILISETAGESWSVLGG